MMHARFSVRGRVLGLFALVLGLFLTVIAWAVSSPVGAVPADLLLGLAGVVALRRGRRRAAAGPTTARRAP